jgi:hypothetical protein
MLLWRRLEVRANERFTFLIDPSGYTFLALLIPDALELTSILASDFTMDLDFRFLLLNPEYP